MKKLKTIVKRPATSDDYEFARQAHHAAYHNVVVRQFGGWDERLQDELFKSAWNESPHEIIIYDDRPCGFFASDERNGVIILHEIVLLPEFQSQGIGTKIIKECISKALDKSLPIHLEVLKENGAISLYRRLGFVESGATETHIKMLFGQPGHNMPLHNNKS